jgi:hypothetical protein
MGFLLAYALEAKTGKRGLLNAHAQKPSKWEFLASIVHRAPDRLFRPAGGNNDFFVGEKGARETASQIESLLQEASLAEKQISDLILRNEKSQ